MDITLRDDSEVDVELLAGLLDSVGWHDKTRDRAQLSQLVRGARWVVSAWDGASLVGFARAISDGVRNAYITTVAVAPSHQRRGIGRALIGRLVDGRDGVQFVLHV